MEGNMYQYVVYYANKFNIIAPLFDTDLHDWNQDTSEQIC